jgi:polysaccharide export outer membrane protein
MPGSGTTQEDPMKQLVAAVLCLVLGALANPLARAADEQPAEASAPAAEAAPYRLGPGDKLRVTVFGEPYLSGEFKVNANGTISMALIEPVQLTGLTVAQAQEVLAKELSEGFTGKTKVNIEILEYRPFFIVGEVRNPGSYPYMADMTVLHAIAIAGGYTPRAAKKRVEIQRGGKDGIRANDTTPVEPGDVITVKERLF